MMMMKSLQQRFTLLVSIGCLASMAMAQDANCSTITEIACETEGFEILCEAIEATNLGDDLNGEMWTVFAPTNDAFNALSEQSVETLLDDVSALTDLLLFHVVAGVVLNSTDLECQEDLQMANADVTTTLCTDDEELDDVFITTSNITTASNATGIFQVGLGNQELPFPRIVATDIVACNGIIHVIDQVLLFDNSTFIVGNDTLVNETVATTTAPTAATAAPTAATAAPTAATAAPTAATAAPTVATAAPTVATVAPTVTPTTVATTIAPTITPSTVLPVGSPVSIGIVTDSPSEIATSGAPVGSPVSIGIVTDAPTGSTNTSCALTGFVCSQDDFSTLCAALGAAGLADALAVEGDVFTVFAPNNAAFAKLGDAALEYLLQPEQKDLLSSLLLFHTVPNAMLESSDLQCVAGDASLITMGNGFDSRTICNRPFIYQKGAGNPEDAKPEIIAADIMDACNGIVHVVNEVMLFRTAEELGIPPPDADPVGTTAPSTTPAVTVPAPTTAPVPTAEGCQTIDEIICSEDQYVALCQRIRKTGVEGALSTGEWTLFAPINDAFVSLPRGFLDELDSDITLLSNFLLFHAAPNQALLKEDLPCVAGQNLVEMATTRDSRTLCVDRVPTFQKGAGNPDDDIPTIIEFDRLACNGVIHTLDKALLFRPIPEEFL